MAPIGIRRTSTTVYLLFVSILSFSFAYRPLDKQAVRANARRGLFARQQEEDHHQRRPDTHHGVHDDLQNRLLAFTNGLPRPHIIEDNEFWKTLFSNNKERKDDGTDEQGKKESIDSESISRCIAEASPSFAPFVPKRLKNIFSPHSALIGTARDEKDDSAWVKNDDDDENSDFFAAVHSYARTMLSGNKARQRECVTKLANKIKQESDDISEKISNAELMSLGHHAFLEVRDTLGRQFGHIDVGALFAGPAFHYYLEQEDSIKTPSWKRRMHRFHKGIDTACVHELNKSLYLADLAYSQTQDEIERGLRELEELIPLHLIYCETVAPPGRPAHFVGIKKNQSRYSSALEIVVAVRGTRTIPDVLTDALLDAVDYRDGKAHSGIMKSGKWLAETHLELFRRLMRLSGKRRLHITLVGHSLGAAACSIAGMELNDHADMDVEVVGFGCPALLSGELSRSTSSYITTVIADSDLVPRMSGATIANLMLNVLEHDWLPSIKRDHHHLVDEVAQMQYPSIMAPLFSDSARRMIKGRANKQLDSIFAEQINNNNNKSNMERIQPVLFPPGKCIHLYRDGSGVSGCISPCTFFAELDFCRRMVDDHSIDTGYRQIFLEVVRQIERDQDFRFEVRHVS